MARKWNGISTLFSRHGTIGNIMLCFYGTLRSWGLLHGVRKTKKQCSISFHVCCIWTGNSFLHAHGYKRVLLPGSTKGQRKRYHVRSLAMETITLRGTMLFLQTWDSRRSLFSKGRINADRKMKLVSYSSP